MNSLSVYMNGYLIGTLVQERNAGHTFTYDTAWLATNDARPISLSMPLRQEKI
ncbi:HipA N-terminal domain-containing protein [Ewingella allii]|uniref:HipA N-terminal domain-containing protein n=1 Tax=Ewingella allii TaxID=3092550 RepID=UPI0037A5EC9C